jgi:hypothetical protein
MEYPYDTTIITMSASWHTGSMIYFALSPFYEPPLYDLMIITYFWTISCYSRGNKDYPDIRSPRVIRYLSGLGTESIDHLYLTLPTTTRLILWDILPPRVSHRHMGITLWGYDAARTLLLMFRRGIVMPYCHVWLILTAFMSYSLPHLA